MEIQFKEEGIHLLVIGPNGVYTSLADTKKPTGGTGEFSMSIHAAFANSTFESNFAFCRTGSTNDPEHPCDPQRGEVNFLKILMEFKKF